jgi:hypothetical protein
MQMANILPDGTVIPSYLNTRELGARGPLRSFSNITLRRGEVQDIVYPDDKRSLSKKYNEYRVLVQMRDGEGAGTSADFYNCVLINDLASGADFSTFTLRPNSKKSEPSGNGSKVLVLCINGDNSQAIILGGVRDGDQDFDTKDLGHHSIQQFNGIRQEINKEGELTITFKGATKTDGSLAEGADSSASGTSLKFARDGSLELAHDDQHLVIDHPNKKVELVAAKELDLSGPTGVNIDSNATVKITAANIKVGGDAAVDALVKGTTYRTAETTMHSAQIAALNAAAAALTTMSASMIAAAGSLAAVTIAPAAPAALKPLAPVAVSLTPMGPQLAAVAAALTAIATTLSTFEGGTASYLSATNTVK